MPTYRVLALDGGGIKGTFTVSFLATLEAALERPIAEYFDLIVGTSTGGIIALGLGAGYSASEVLTFYEELGSSVFLNFGLLTKLRQLAQPKYGNDRLRHVLISKFGDTKLGESKRRLVIPSVNLESGEVHIYKTAHHPKFEYDYKVPMIDVAIATSAAPVYFPTHILESGVPLIDGGLWANNPAGMAVVEAVAVLGWPRDEIRLLSVGCTTSPPTTASLVGRLTGLIGWLPKLMEVVFAAQSSASHGTAKLLIGPQNLYRYSPTVAPGRFALDSISGMEALRGLGDSEARKALPDLRPVFFGDPAASFDPYRKL